jgi:recA bacterial DNA recombination protein
MANLALASLWQRASDLALTRATSRFPALDIPCISLWKQGLQRGSIAEIIGRRSSGRTACLLHVLAQATQKGEICALVDTHNRFDPASAEKSGVRLQHLLWVRCGSKVEHAIRATDLLLHAGGFGIVVLDLCETNYKHLNKIPLSYWFRFRRAIESTPTILLISAESKQAKSCSLNVLNLKVKAPHWAGFPGHRLLRSLTVSASLEKPALKKPEPMLLAG